MDGGDEDLYDEFGNYIGPELDSDEEEGGPVEDDEDDEESGDDEEEEAAGGGGQEDADMDDEGDEGRIVLHEDKK